ncbi:PRC-barrel domain-containing protein [Modicisalibacter luteus]|uniref:PRC-barrel domain-containing protein n=1 Tax=Modicisalibacter luteus TaxID=453962 RepID=A0ABV7M1T7_9GAMM|nr:PRC-barrel domain-containing protein [Halomonas lutea]GHB09692.1 hypothetical protein GCM10007159_34840 [Halomonas lutea]
MHMEQKPKLHKLGLQIAAVSAAGVSLAMSPAFAQQASGQVEQRVSAEFNQLDQNGDQSLQWDEVQQRLNEANMQQNREQVMSEYDRNNDQALNLQEFQPLLVAITERGQNVDAPEEVVVQSQQPKVVVDTDPPEVQVDPAEPEVAVDQKAPKVKVDPADPQVTVDQQKPKVIVTQPKPTVEVTVPDPEVKVVMRDPNVQVDTNKPEVEVIQQKPEVTVNQGKPDVSVNQPEPEVAVQPSKPRVAVDGDEQANVAVRDDSGQAQVQVESSDPNVNVAGAEPEVTVEEANNADVQVVEGEQQQQQNSGSQQNALYSLMVTDIEGQRVFDTSGNELGEVDHVVTANNSNQVGVVVTRGGVLGAGQEELLVPLNELQMNNDRLVWQTNQSVEEIKQSEYNASNYTEVSNQNQALGEVASQ